MKRIPRLLTRKAKIISKRMPDIIAKTLFAKPVEELGVVLRKVDPGELRYPVKDSDIQVINRFEGNRHANVESIYMPKESDLRTGFMVFHVRHTFFGKRQVFLLLYTERGFWG